MLYEVPEVVFSIKTILAFATGFILGVASTLFVVYCVGKYARW